MKMKIVFAFLLALCIYVVCGFDGCSVPPQPGTPAGGFPVTAANVLEDSAGNTISSGPAPGVAVSGNWLADNTNAAGSTKSFALSTDENGNGFVAGGRINSEWESSVLWTAPCTLQGQTATFDNVGPIAGIGWACIEVIITETANSSTHFVLPGAAPSTLTSYGNFSTTYGEPQLRVYKGGAAPGFVSSVLASNVAAGYSATFPFPTQANGSPLAQGFYAIVNEDVGSGGSPIWVDSSYLAVGGTTTLSSAFGVDAADIVNTTTICTRYGCNPPTSTTGSAPILTQYYAGTVLSWNNGATIPVGSEPVAVKGYGSYTSTSHSGFDAFAITGPANAIVANSGSSSVSIVSFATNTNIKNIPVGAQPMALTLNSAATMAYIASHGNGSLAEINLSTEAVTRTVGGLAGALSVAMDPSGSYVWVGGTNYLYKISLSTFTVVSNYAVSGSVTSLAASNARNELVYTLVENCCTSSSSYAANELLLSNLSKPGSYAQATASPYAAYTMNGTLPTAAALPQATNIVSTRFSNGMGASSTPTGFVVYDLVTHETLMNGTTPTPVRGIASDPDAMYAYFTLPDSNEYITVPLESTP